MTAAIFLKWRCKVRSFMDCSSHRHFSIHACCGSSTFGPSHFLWGGLLCIHALSFRPLGMLAPIALDRPGSAISVLVRGPGCSGKLMPAAMPADLFVSSVRGPYLAFLRRLTGGTQYGSRTTHERAVTKRGARSLRPVALLRQTLALPWKPSNRTRAEQTNRS